MMPISVTGNKAPPAWRHGGFTLLEILLVLLIVVVVTAMVVPSFTALSRPSVRDEARHLAMILRMAEDESAMNGRPMVWYATRHAYGFERHDEQGKWVTLTGRPFGRHPLPPGMLLRVRPAAALARIQDGLGRSSPEPVRARLLLMPAQGVLSPAEIVLGLDANAGEGVHIRLRPGHGGIRIIEGAG